jgi:glycosyltransferase involved in cell wall biosynthesis
VPSPEVSVVVPNYNHARYLEQRLDSVLAQTCRDFEVIILDDRSTDDSRRIIERYREHPAVRHVVFNDVNTGSPFRQWERGIGLAAGRWIWLAESDDYCEPELLETLLGETRRHPDVGIAFCRSEWVDAAGQAGEDLSIYREDAFFEGPAAVKRMLFHCTVHNASSAIIRRDLAATAVRGLGRYKACGDWIFYVRVLQRANLAFTARRLNSFRWYHANVSSRAKARLWDTEGVHVLDEVSFRRVRHTPVEFSNLIGHWRGRAGGLTAADRLAAWRSIAWAGLRYRATRLLPGRDDRRA